MRLRIEKTFSGFLKCLFVALPCSTYAQISYSAIAANNTSACSERGVPPYCKSAFTGNKTDPARRFHLNTTEVIARYLGSCFSASCPFHMAIMEDKGAFSSQCPKGKKDQTSCIVKNLNRDMDYINSHYAKQPWYLTDRDNPIVLFFLHEPEWSGTDWGRVWSEVKSHTNSFARPFKFVFEEEDVNCWRHILGDGCYVWMNSAKWSTQVQFDWVVSSNAKPVYYQDF